MLSNEDISRYGEIGKVISFFQEIDRIPRKSGWAFILIHKMQALQKIEMI